MSPSDLSSVTAVIRKRCAIVNDTAGVCLTDYNRLTTFYDNQYVIFFQVTLRTNENRMSKSTSNLATSKKVVYRACVVSQSATVPDISITIMDKNHVDDFFSLL